MALIIIMGGGFVHDLRSAADSDYASLEEVVKAIAKNAQALEIRNNILSLNKNLLKKNVSNSVLNSALSEFQKEFIEQKDMDFETYGDFMWMTDLGDDNSKIINRLEELHKQYENLSQEGKDIFNETLLYWTPPQINSLNDYLDQAKKSNIIQTTSNMSFISPKIESLDDKNFTRDISNLVWLAPKTNQEAIMKVINGIKKKYDIEDKVSPENITKHSNALEDALESLKPFISSDTFAMYSIVGKPKNIQTDINKIYTLPLKAVNEIDDYNVMALRYLLKSFVDKWHNNLKTGDDKKQFNETVSLLVKKMKPFRKETASSASSSSQQQQYSSTSSSSAQEQQTMPQSSSEKNRLNQILNNPFKALNVNLAYSPETLKYNYHGYAKYIPEMGLISNPWTPAMYKYAETILGGDLVKKDASGNYQSDKIGYILDFKKITQAYRTLQKQHHPDQKARMATKDNKDLAREAGTLVSKVIKNAFDIFKKDYELRDIFKKDYELRNEIQKSMATAQAKQQSPSSSSSQEDIYLSSPLSFSPTQSPKTMGLKTPEDSKGDKRLKEKLFTSLETFINNSPLGKQLEEIKQFLKPWDSTNALQLIKNVSIKLYELRLQKFKHLKNIIQNRKITYKPAQAFQNHFKNMQNGVNMITKAQNLETAIAQLHGFFKSINLVDQQLMKMAEIIRSQK